MTQGESQFCFKTKFDQTILLGKKAKNISELLDHVRTVPSSSIYYHTHRFLEQHHYLAPEPPNDFAYWVSSVLSEDALGERLSSIDIIQFHSIEELRARIVSVIEDYLNSTARRVDVPDGEELYFMASKTFILRTPYVAHTLTDFKHCLKLITIQSLYYHIFDSRLRFGQEENDFSLFFKKLGQEGLAEEVARLDPYSQSLDALKKNIIRLVEEYDQH